MKNKEKSATTYIIKISTLVFVISLLLSLCIEGVLNGFSLESFELEIADMANCIITALATGLVLWELKENKNIIENENKIKEAEFMLQYNQSFIQDTNMTEVENLLEKQCFYELTSEIITDENHQKFVNYLVYLESIAPLVIKNILDLEYIDDLMAYRFFIAVNNPELQEKELFKFPEYYKGCFKLYKEWSQYRNKHDLKIPMEDTALNKWSDFSKYSE